MKHLLLPPPPLLEEEEDCPVSDMFATEFWGSFDVIARVALLSPTDVGLNDTTIEQEIDEARGELQEFINVKSDRFWPVIAMD
jgi:hypothetical protein